MPLYQIVRCSECGIFQIEQVKKVPKWNCITCGTKQSVKKIYAESTSTGDLRKVVMDFNMKRGQLEAEKSIQAAISKHPALRPDVPEVAQLSSSTMQSLQAHIHNNFQASPPKPIPQTQHQQSAAPQPSYAQAPIREPPKIVEKPYTKPVELPKPAPVAVAVAKKPSVYSQLSSNPNFVSPFSFASTTSMPYTSSLASAKAELIKESRD